jgi:hypothetical protein
MSMSLFLPTAIVIPFRNIKYANIPLLFGEEQKVRQLEDHFIFPNGIS